MMEKAVYTSVFDDDIACQSGCLYDPLTKEVSEIETASNAEDAVNADALTDEYVTLAGGEILRASDGVVFQY